MNQAGLEIDLLPAQNGKLRDAQPMPVGEKHERPITRAVAETRSEFRLNGECESRRH